MLTVIGLGFVGLTTALGFAEKGFKVYGYEIDRPRIDSLGAGKVPCGKRLQPAQQNDSIAARTIEGPLMLNTQYPPLFVGPYRFRY